MSAVNSYRRLRITCAFGAALCATTAGNPYPSSVEASELAPESTTAFESPPAQLPQLPASGTDVRVEQLPAEFQSFALGLVLDAIPNDYENLKKWGGTREIWDGVKVRIDDGQLKTKRRKKTVNHGSWSRYTLKLVEPQKNVRINWTNVQKTESGAASFDVTLEAKLDVLGQFQEWNRGIKLLSITAEATADVRLRLSCTLATNLDITQVPPDIVFDPHVVQAELAVVDLKLHRISKADGPVVKELSWSVEQMVREQVAEKNDKLADKLNRQIEKHRDHLKISPSQFVKGQMEGQMKGQKDIKDLKDQRDFQGQKTK